MKERFTEVYGLASSILTFKFDGNSLKNHETPALSEMEESDVIDVTVRTLFMI